MAKLNEKVAIVTGASKGIGAAIAAAIAKEGAAVAVNYASDREGAEKTVKQISNAGGKAVAVQGNVERGEDAERIVKTTIEAFGRLDILVNNAGVHKFAPVEDFTEDDFHTIFNINVLGPLLMIRAASFHLGEGASVINISSAVTSALPPASAVYTGSKAAIDAMTGVLAAELGPRKIRINAINPGMTDTEGNRAAGIIGSARANAAVDLTPLRRVGTPTDIASVAVFLASDDARWVTGERLTVSGGLRR